VAVAKTELRRQERQIQITVWAPTPAARKAVAEPIDLALAELSFFPVEGEKVRLIYRSSAISDASQKQRLLRRDLIYTVEYPTMKTETLTEIVVFTQKVRALDGTLLSTHDV
jgi:hypothetical protein